MCGLSQVLWLKCCAYMCVSRRRCLSGRAAASASTSLPAPAPPASSSSSSSSSSWSSSSSSSSLSAAATATAAAAAAAVVTCGAFALEDAGADARVQVGQHVAEHCVVPRLQGHRFELLHVSQRGPAGYPACFQHLPLAHRVVLHAARSSWELFSWASWSARRAARWCACRRLACASSRPRRRRHAGAARQ